MRYLLIILCVFLIGCTCNPKQVHTIMFTDSKVLVILTDETVCWATREMNIKCGDHVSIKKVNDEFFIINKQEGNHASKDL